MVLIFIPVEIIDQRILLPIVAPAGRLHVGDDRFGSGEHGVDRCELRGQRVVLADLARLPFPGRDGASRRFRRRGHLAVGAKPSKAANTIRAQRPADRFHVLLDLFDTRRAGDDA